MIHITSFILSTTGINVHALSSLSIAYVACVAGSLALAWWLDRRRRSKK